MALQVPDNRWLIWLQGVTVPTPSGCWLWKGSTSSSGYGTIRIVTDQSRTWMVHRAAWSAHAGANVPDGYEIDHTCNTRNCCSPAHLEPVSREENIRRGVERRAALRPPPPLRRPAGSIRVRANRFTVRYRDRSSGTTVETSRTFGTREEAEEFLSTLRRRYVR